MKLRCTYLLLIIALLVCSSVSSAQDFYIGRNPAKALLPPKHAGKKALNKQKKDFKILKTSLLENTGNPYLYNDSLTLLAKFNAVEEQLNESLSEWELFYLFSNMVSEVGCGHTLITPSKKLTTAFYSVRSTLPGDVTLVDKKLYIFTSFRSKDRTKLSKGDEIIAINGVAVVEMLTEMYKHVSSDGDNTTMKDRLFKDFFLFYYFCTYGISPEFKLDYVSKGDTANTMVEADYPPISSLSRKSRRNPLTHMPRRSEWGRMKISKANDYAMIKFTTFFYSDGPAYHQFLEGTFRKLKKSGVNNLIIDLRDNLGGRPQMQLMGYLANAEVPVIMMEAEDTRALTNRRYIKKTKYYKVYRKQVKIAKRLGTRNGDKYQLEGKSPKDFSENGFTGRIIVLTNGLTFSAASNLAANLKDKCGAIVIGEESGGSYKEGNTGNLLLRLPNTKFEIMMNPVYYNNRTSLEVGKAGLPPDIYVTDKYGQKRSDDPYLDTAVSFIASNKN